MITVTPFPASALWTCAGNRGGEDQIRVRSERFDASSGATISSAERRKVASRGPPGRNRFPTNLQKAGKPLRRQRCASRSNEDLAASTACWTRNTSLALSSTMRIRARRRDDGAMAIRMTPMDVLKYLNTFVAVPEGRRRWRAYAAIRGRGGGIVLGNSGDRRHWLHSPAVMVGSRRKHSGLRGSGGDGGSSCSGGPEES